MIQMEGASYDGRRKKSEWILITSRKFLFNVNDYVSMLVSWDSGYSGSTKSIHVTIPVCKRLYSVSGMTWITNPHTHSTFQPVSLPDIIQQEIQHIYPYSLWKRTQTKHLISQGGCWDADTLGVCCSAQRRPMDCQADLTGAGSD